MQGAGKMLCSSTARELASRSAVDTALHNTLCNALGRVGIGESKLRGAPADECDDHLQRTVESLKDAQAQRVQAASTVGQVRWQWDRTEVQTADGC